MSNPPHQHFGEKRTAPLPSGRVPKRSGITPDGHRALGYC